MNNRMIDLLIVLILVLSMTTSITAFDLLKSNGPGMGETISLSESSASDYLTAPNSSLADKSVLVEFGLNRKFDIKYLDQVYLNSAYRVKKFSFTLGFSQFGKSELYVEKNGRLGTAFHLRDLTIGLSVDWMAVDFNDQYEKLSAFGLNSSIAYRYKQIAAAFVVERINSPTLDENSEKLNSRYSLYTELIGVGSFSITARGTFEKDQTAQFGLGQKLKLRNKASFFWGISTAPLIFGGGFMFNIADGYLSYNASYHPTLGMSHLVTLSYRFGKKVNSHNPEDLF